MSSIVAANLFKVDGLVAVITGGATGKWPSKLSEMLSSKER